MIEATEAAAIETAGRQAFPGFELRVLEQTASTQDVVREAVRGGAHPGFCCVAALQTSGRGRQGRTWTAPAGTSLLASVAVAVGSELAGAVPIAAGLALREAIEATSGVAPRVRWPNDLLAGTAKLAGILCEVETAPRWAGTAVVVGMGANLRVQSFPPGVRAVSLHEVAETPPSAAQLLAAVLPRLAARLDTMADAGTAGLRAEWMEHAAGIGEPVTVVSQAGTVSGVAEGIDTDGALLVRSGGRLVRMLAGDVHIGEQGWPGPDARRGG